MFGTNLKADMIFNIIIELTGTLTFLFTDLLYLALYIQLWSPSFYFFGSETKNSTCSDQNKKNECFSHFS